MTFTITSTSTNKIYLSEDRKSISVDVTIIGLGKKGKVEIPINIGTTIGDIPLSLGEKIPDEIDAKMLSWFNEKYPST